MGEVLLVKQLRKAFQLLQSTLDLWETTLTDTGQTIASVSNLCEQHTRCKQVDVETLPMIKSFPDVQDKLLCKILTEINLKLISLQTRLTILKSMQDKFTKQQEHCMKVYQKHTEELDLDKMTLSTATCPSFSTLLEMLGDSDNLLFELYNIKLHWLEQLSEGTTDTENLSKTWAAYDKEILQKLKGYLCFVSVFMQEGAG